MIPVCKELGISEARDACLSNFVTRVRENLHVVLCVSPVGDALRIRCRNFPSLINCTTIDWFFPWPEAALVSVAERFIEGVPLPSDEVSRVLWAEGHAVSKRGVLRTTKRSLSVVNQGKHCCGQAGPLCAYPTTGASRTGEDVRSGAYFNQCLRGPLLRRARASRVHDA